TVAGYLYFSHARTREEIVATAAAVFDALREGVFGSERPRVFPLEDAVRAHRALEDRRRTGKVLLSTVAGAEEEGAP
ncbi:MAG TPA: zinc-binding dehydrogenase, partial [Myxococcaceae bacterium]|nr:zinc-binding dehydrogenase [Myxococcaceae bacterium]